MIKDHLKLSFAVGPVQADIKSETIFSSLRNRMEASVGASTSSYRKLTIARVWNCASRSGWVTDSSFYSFSNLLIRIRKHS